MDLCSGPVENLYSLKGRKGETCIADWQLKLFWGLTALHKEVLKLQKFSDFHSSSLAILEPSNIIWCSELNLLAARKPGTEVLNCNPILKPVDILMQRFPHRLSHGEDRQPLVDSLKFVSCLHLQQSMKII